MKKIVVLYHNRCWDGFGAAWAAWRKFKNRALYIGVEHHLPLLKGLKNKEIYLLDFCYDKKTMQNMLRNNRKVVVIDHHISRKTEAQLGDEHVFDNNHSGSVLAWKYFHPKNKVPKLLRHVEDTDLWKFKLPHSKELLLSIDLLSYTFKNWDKIANDWEKSNGTKKYLVQGKAIMAYVQTMVSELAGLADKVIFEGRKVLAVNGPRFLRSDLGNELVKRGSPFGIVWYLRGRNVIVSLRAMGKVNVAKLAEKYGGGGHKNAAGFTFKSRLENKFPWKTIK